MSEKEENDNFVTVLAVGAEQQEPDSENINFESNGPGYVTVLTIGDTENNNKVLKDVTEEVLVYRLPGERLGFGLKFEGGTKANEFVKRLFIQSCAADSPASRVKSSWGKLTEGDEVLEIDSIPVNTMTRIDCVRCLKDSNVAIKLLVRHRYDNHKPKMKCEDEPPQIIGTEEKRTPPAPPPVPPRKIPRKLLKNANPVPPKEIPENPQDNSTPPAATNIKSKKLQSPRSSIKSYYSPNVPRRDRRFSDGSLGPPDAEVYVDLFLQESTQSLSESDDTGSTISTVIDRFGSFPTTTTSSFSGSLPSTPTSIQRQLDISNITIYDDEDSTTTNKPSVKSLVQSKEENNNIIVNPVEEGSPSCFQDAPLSYGNESTKIIVPDEVDEPPSEQPEESKPPVKKPPVPPRARDSVKNTETPKEAKNTDLPRLVDFVPKSSSNGLKENIENSTEIMKLFLENERYKSTYSDYETDENDNVDTYANGIDIYSSKWSLSSQLATIGEVEEEAGSEIGFNRPLTKTTPVVIVENADCSNESEKIQCQIETLNNMNSKEADGKMATLPSDSRQPPDGHEFPDFIENTESVKRSQSYFEDNVKNRHSDTFTHKDTYRTTLEFPIRPTNLILCHSVSSSNTDLRPKMYDSTEDLKYSGLVQEPPTNLHTRSQSLIDMSALSKQKNTKWNVLMEQRRKGLSKLKGLVIPEASESDILPSVSIPEIKSQNTATFVPVQKVDNNVSTQTFSSSYSDYSIKPSVPPWPVITSNNIPKYSPAFKRRSLQVYPTSISKNGTSDYTSHSDLIKFYDKPSSKTYKANEDDLNPPKSLESISSPTRSDCSFDYVSSTKRYIRDSFGKSLQSKEDESDNDSAVSSSQSSYNSRFSPPPSPTRSCELNSYKNKSEDDDKLNIQNRLLKPSSVEAINRKNILASAKCRSGKDLKIGSPVIRRKQEENQKSDQSETVEKPKEEIVPKPPEARILDKVNDAFADVEMISKQIEIKESTKKPSKIEEIEAPQKPPLKSNITPAKPPTCPVTSKNHTKDSKENKFSPLYKTFDIRSRQAKPINVKALKENFENFGSKPPCPAVKIPIYKSQIATKNVKAEIAKTESKIISKLETPVKKTEKVEVKPKEARVIKQEEENKVIKKVEKNKADAKTITLHLDSLGGSLGITLAGGTDYENKEISVHRIRYGSVAYHDGRLKRGDKIVSVNGKSTSNLTHDEAVELLKEPVTEFVIEMEEGIEIVPSAGSNLQRRSSSLSVLTDIKSATAVEVPAKKANNVISFLKDGAGLGFSIEGGKDSPVGDVPLIVKKIFTGGAADKNGQLKVGDEILFINDISFSNLSRMEAWTIMKKVPEGNVSIHIFR
ncbi:uncharacterized protein LOC108916947 isoform X3 [Anoplophora glabripennis]|uniref:uncharacterized protein LOC108916947 isoform X3 n=1 Tax=Anoplophora glabripennis TaxID=217634 RepID=UPI000873C60F|nr:uncharacterized protein LOC108916947 isoform X3 [Anoplophora glabripennis]